MFPLAVRKRGGRLIECLIRAGSDNTRRGTLAHVTIPDTVTLSLSVSTLNVCDKWMINKGLNNNVDHVMTVLGVLFGGGGGGDSNP